MKKTLIITSEQVRARAVEIIKKLPLEPAHQVKICEHKVNRSVAQNALYWQWVGIIADELGYTKDEMHRQYKGQFMAPIMLKYPDDYAEFCSMVGEIQELRGHGWGEGADRLAKKTLWLISTTKLKTKHMSEYMDDVSKHAASLDIRLPVLDL